MIKPIYLQSKAKINAARKGCFQYSDLSSLGQCKGTRQKNNKKNPSKQLSCTTGDPETILLLVIQVPLQNV